MHITTSRGNTYSYIRRTNEIVGGLVEEQSYEWNFAPLSVFSGFPEVFMFIIGITEQCNLRCTYCCYSGAYEHNRSHSQKLIESGDIDEIYDFILRSSTKRPIHIAFYGGEPLLQYPLIHYAIQRGHELLGGEVTFSVTTNGTVLTPEKIDWLVAQHVELVISLDGTKTFHDKHRVYANGHGSYKRVHETLSYIAGNYPQHLNLISLQMTLETYRDIDKIAEKWHNDPLLRYLAPSNIHGLAANFAKGVNKIEYEDVRSFYEHLLDVYEHHQDWAVLRVLFEESIADWKERPIIEASGPVPMATCMPVNTKLYIDASKEIGVCEKMADMYRIGNIAKGIDWSKANSLVRSYYDRRLERCKNCPAVRMCDMCLTALEYTDEQWDILCHNVQVYTRVFMFVFCEMAERGLLQ